MYPGRLPSATSAADSVFLAAAPPRSVISRPTVHSAALVSAYEGSVHSTALTGWNQMSSSAVILSVNMPGSVAETHPLLSAVAMFAGDW